ncbi:MAG: hypothetical protein WC565_02320 [Parcubacteria group bacterium]
MDDIVKKEKKPIKIWHLAILGAALIFMVASLLLNRIPNLSKLTAENNSETNLPEENNSGMNEEENSIPEETPKIISVQDVNISGLGPVETYRIIRGEILKIKNIDDLILFTELYQSEENRDSSIQKYNQMRDVIKGTGGFITEESMVAIIMATMPRGEIKNVELLSESDKKADIEITLDDGKKADVEMIFEGNLWKLNKTTWKQ